MKATKETHLVKACLEYLHLAGVFAWRVNSGAVVLGTGSGKRFVRFGSLNGVSDIIGIVPGGTMLAVECKVRPNKPSPAQEAFLETVREMGGKAIVAYTVEDVIEGLR